MPLKSKAQFRKWQELAKKGKISKAQLKEAMDKTPDFNSLPERVRPKK